MGQSFDGSFTAAVQHGTKQISLPLQHDGNFYATCVKRNYIAAPASGYEPIIGQRTAYTALLKYSDDLSNAVWTKAASTGTASAGTDPEGGTTATKLAEDNTNAAHNASQVMTVAAGALSFGVLAKAAERTQFRLRIYNATDGSLGSTVFNLSTGAITSGTGAIKKLLNGWYWCSVQTTPTVTNSTAFIDLTNDGSTFSYTGTTGSGVLLWRATAYLAAAIGPAVATTSVTRAVTSPAVDPDDPLAFLVDEMEPDASTLELGVARWGREYANVPAEITVPTSVQLTKPSLTGTFPQVFGSYRLFQPDTTLIQYDAYTAQTVISDSGAPSLTPTGGTYTLTFGGYTTGAIAYNAVAATVQTALNALTSFTDRGSCVVTGSYTAGFTITFNSYAQITINTGSLTGGTITAPVSLTNGGYTQIVPAYLGPFPYVLTGGVDTSAITNGDGGYGLGSSFGYYNGKYIDVYLGGNGGATGGSFTISTYATTSGPIAYNDSFATIGATLNAMGIGNCTVGAHPSWPGDTQPLNSGAIRFRITCTSGAVTGGTFTMTAFGSTTAAIAHNATSATVQAELNALSAVANRGNCIVSGHLTAGFTIEFANAVMTGAAGSLTPTSSISLSLSDGTIGRIQSYTLASTTATRDLYVPDHGLVIGNVLYVRSGSTYYSAIETFTVPSENIIRLNVFASSSYVAAGTITEVGKRTKQSYAPGLASLRASRVTDYYLPGLTLGIATASDIVVPANQSDGAAFLEAVFAGSGTINYAVGDLAFWRGPILSVAKTTLNAADV